MKRDTIKLASKQFDVLIIGGGIYGVNAARDAALRGLSVAVIDKDDFGAATSSNSLKIIHGGLRYLQHADFKRMRESITERKILMEIAPHLVHPLPCIMPTYGHALKGKEVMAVALFLNDLIGYDRNKIPDTQKHLPRGRVVSKKECLNIIPGLSDENLTGGAIWYDCQVMNSERMLISVLHSAVENGAVAANYVEMKDFIIRENQVIGIKALDKISGESITISAKLVMNNSGPWFNSVLQHLNGSVKKPEVQLSAAMNLVVRKKLFPEFAVGIWSKEEFKDADAIISKGSRLFFITPWKEYSLIGTTHVQFQGEPDDFHVSEKDIEQFIADVNAAYPVANLNRQDVTFFYGGLLPADDIDHTTLDVKLLKSYKIIDHELESNLKGLLTVVGVKYTTARDVAEKTIDYAMEKLGRKDVPSVSSKTKVYGGNIDFFADYLREEKSKATVNISENTIEHLVRNYGSEYRKILTYIDEKSELAKPVYEKSPVLQAEVIHAVREEMACTLKDIVRVRTELGSAEYPGEAALRTCASLAARELNWDKQKIEDEIEVTKKVFIAS